MADRGGGTHADGDRDCRVAAARRSGPSVALWRMPTARLRLTRARRTQPRFRAPPQHSRRPRRRSARVLRCPASAERCVRWSNRANGSGWNWRRCPARRCPALTATLGAAAGALDAIAAGSDPAPSLTDLARSARGIGEPAARRRAVSLVEWIAAAGRRSHAGALGAAPRRHPLHVLRAELTLRSSAFRHAARLSVALVVAGIVYRGLSLGSGYWVPLDGPVRAQARLRDHDGARDRAGRGDDGRGHHRLGDRHAVLTLRRRGRSAARAPGLHRVRGLPGQLHAVLGRADGADRAAG